MRVLAQLRLRWESCRHVQSVVGHVHAKNARLTSVAAGQAKERSRRPRAPPGAQLCTSSRQVDPPRVCISFRPAKE